MQFSTLNESDLHHSLKILYAETYEGKTEVEQDGHVYDIVTKNGNVIEIQTANLRKLLPKIEDSISKGHNVKLVHPVIITKRILLSNEQGNKISYRRSPKKGSIYDVFKELTGIYTILLNPKFSLELIMVEMTEERIRMEEPVQTQNKRRRFRKNWIKTNKRLDNILETKTFNNANDYLKLFPNLPEIFCAKDINSLVNTRNGNLILWVLLRMNIIELVKKTGNTKYYKVNTRDSQLIQ